MIRSAGEIVGLQRPAPQPWARSTTGFATYDNGFVDYEAIYRSQPAVRTVISFIARNIAELGIHVFDRVSDTERQRLADHPLAQLLARPQPAPSKVTRYRLIDATVNDLGIYDQAFWAKIRAGDSGRVGALLRIPPNKIEPIGENWLVPDGYRIGGRSGREVDADDVVHFYGFNPLDARVGLSKMETLRAILAEEISIDQYRSWYWQNAARIGGVIERPLDAPEWSDPARKRFRQEWHALHTGTVNSGGTAILEDGMTWKPASFSAKDSQLVEGRKLSREEVAAVYHIPQHAVGILDHATFSNIVEQNRQLYTDAFGPTIQSMKEDLELQLLPDLDDRPTVYVQFNIAAKLRGSFEQKAAQIGAAVGGPWMTPNEGRAMDELPPVDGGDVLNPSPTTPGAPAAAGDTGDDSTTRTPAPAPDDDEGEAA